MPCRLLEMGEEMPQEMKIKNQGQLILICGLAGAGYSTALNILSDAGFSTVDNLPFAMVNQLVSAEVEAAERKMAVSLDARTSGFSASAIEAMMADIKNRIGDACKIVFLHASEDEIFCRFNAARRRHPLDKNDCGLSRAIKQDWQEMKEIEAIADITIDTSNTNPNHFRQILLGKLGLENPQKIPVFIKSFSYRKGLPAEADMILDMRFLDNPHWQKGLAEKTGLDKGVQDYIRGDEGFEKFINAITNVLTESLPRLAEQGRPQFTIAFGCTGGRHRSVFTAVRMAEIIEEMGHKTHINHSNIPLV